MPSWLHFSVSNRPCVLGAQTAPPSVRAFPSRTSEARFSRGIHETTHWTRSLCHGKTAPTSGTPRWWPWSVWGLVVSDWCQPTVTCPVCLAGHSLAHAHQHDFESPFPYLLLLWDWRSTFQANHLAWALTSRSVPYRIDILSRTATAALASCEAQLDRCACHLPAMRKVESFWSVSVQ